MCRVWFLISWCLRSNFLIPNLPSVKSRLVAHQNKERVSHWNSKMANWCLRSIQFWFVWLYHYLLLDSWFSCRLWESNVTQCPNLLTCGELNSLWFKKRRRGHVGKGEGTKRGGREVSLYYCKCQKAKAAKSQLIDCDWYNNYFSVLSLRIFFILWINSIYCILIYNINITDIIWIESNSCISHSSS